MLSGAGPSADSAKYFAEEKSGQIRSLQRGRGGVPTPLLASLNGKYGLAHVVPTGRLGNANGILEEKA